MGRELAMVPVSTPIRRGFTIAELVFAIGLLALIAVVSIGFFVRLTVSSTKSGDQTVALELAHRVLEEYSLQDPAYWAVNSNEELSTHDPETNTTFYYRLRYRRLSPADAQMGDLYRLDVDVSWWAPDPSNPHAAHTRRDYGKLQLHLSDVVFVEDYP